MLGLVGNTEDRFSHVAAHIISQVGQFQLIEATAMASMLMYQVHCHPGIVLSFDVASTCQAMAFGDSSGSFFSLTF